MQNNNIGPFSFSIYKTTQNGSKILKVKSDTKKLLGENIQEKVLDSGVHNNSFWYTIKKTDHKKQVGLSKQKVSVQQKEWSK